MFFLNCQAPGVTQLNEIPEKLETTAGKKNSVLTLQGSSFKSMSSSQKVYNFYCFTSPAETVVSYFSGYCFCFSKFCTRLNTEPWKTSKLFLQVFPDYLDAGSTGKCVQPVFQTSEISWNNFWISEGLSKWVPNTTLFKVFLSQSIRQLFLCSWQLNDNRPVADTFVPWLVLAHR